MALWRGLYKRRVARRSRGCRVICLLVVLRAANGNAPRSMSSNWPNGVKRCVTQVITCRVALIPFHRTTGCLHMRCITFRNLHDSSALPTRTLPLCYGVFFLLSFFHAQSTDARHPEPCVSHLSSSSDWGSRPAPSIQSRALDRRTDSRLLFHPEGSVHPSLHILYQEV